jgi:hypothetical protein
MPKGVEHANWLATENDLAVGADFSDAERR